MNRNFRAGLIIGFALALSVGAALAQEAAPQPSAIFMLQAGMPEEGGPPGAFGERIELLGFEGMHRGQVVKGAPFSATATSETTQKLPDDTLIDRTTTSKLYRDGQGRSRREVQFSGFGPFAGAGKAHTMVMINDPVAGAHYMLDTEEKIAHKMNMRSHNGDGPEKDGPRKPKMSSAELTKESLGPQSIYGVNADGTALNVEYTRVTHMIPKGRIGNNRDINVVFESWYSPDLQIVVKSARTDPRFGTTTYTVTNLQRAEPAAALFTVPPDYTVKEGPPNNGRHRFHGGPPPGASSDAPAPPPAN